MAENEITTTADAPVADPNVSIADMHEYGYHYAGMTPLTKEKALELFDADKEIYLLSDDDTESAAESRKEIEDFDGLFGYEGNSDERPAHAQAELFDDAAGSGTDAGDTFSIYQLKQTKETKPYRWMSVSELKSAGLSVKRDNYEHIYTAPLPIGADLEGIFAKFNTDIPSDFHGHSLSVSDIVSLDRGGKQTAYYVDNIGFAEVSELINTRGELRKFADVDVIGSLKAIMESHTEHYKSDFDLDADLIRKLAVSENPEDRRLLWMARPAGTWLLREREAHLLGTWEHNTWKFYGEQTKDKILAYAVELKADRGSHVTGTIHELDYQKHMERLKNLALPVSHDMIFFEDGTVCQKNADAFRNYVEKYQVQHGEKPSFTFMPCPENEGELNTILRRERMKRDYHSVPGDMRQHIEELNRCKDNNYLKNAELDTEQNYNQIDGLLNNLQEGEAKAKPSVKDRLKEAEKSVVPPAKNPATKTDREPEL